MSSITGLSNNGYTSRLAGEDLTIATMGCVKISDKYIYKASDAAGYIMCGVIRDNVDSGDKATIDFPCAWVANSGVDALEEDDIGKICYVEDETTVAETAAAVATGLIAGRVLNVDSTKGVLVDFSKKTADTVSAT